MTTLEPLTPRERAILDYLADAEARGLDVVAIPDPDGSGRTTLHAVDPGRPDDWPSHVRDYVTAQALNATKEDGMSFGPRTPSDAALERIAHALERLADALAERPVPIVVALTIPTDLLSMLIPADLARRIREVREAAALAAPDAAPAEVAS